MTEPWWSDDRIELHLGDCLEVLATMEPASVDAIVTDPPYGLEFMGKDWDRFSGATSDRDFKGFVLSQQRTRNVKCPDCGKWAYDHPGRLCECGGIRRVQGSAFQHWCEQWAAECLRVLKPGGHLLAFGGTRTYHRLACGIEDAGFEIRDSMHWIYGGGFPKSLDVSKAIDKRAEENSETKRRISAVAEVIRSHREAAGMTPQQVSLAVVGTPSGACWNWEHQQLPSVEMWPAIKLALGIPDVYDGLIEGDRAQFIAAEREIVGLDRNWGSPSASTPNAPNGQWDITVAATDAAARWQGWGTALKPAHEPIIVARKPLAGTVAGNVIVHGTGALNIDGCRVDGAERPARAAAPMPDEESAAVRAEQWRLKSSRAVGTTSVGRWPANVLLGPDAAAEMDRQSGAARSSGIYRPVDHGPNGHETATTFPTPGIPGTMYGDSGGASRFFPVFRYEAKASSSERPRGEDGTAHPTVKPVDLMAWLVRLVTPPGGLVLDPFGGSGTTAEACLVEGFRCVLIEKDPAYAELIRTRLRKDIQPVMFGTEAS